MNEQYISFKVAKLLKEKGFNIPLNTSYEVYLWQMYDENGEIHWGVYNSDWYFRITQQMACSWLRKRGIHIMSTIGCDVDRTPRIFYGVVIALFNDYGDIDLRDPLDEKGYDSPEEAIEAVLEYVLKNLI